MHSEVALRQLAEVEQWTMGDMYTVYAIYNHKTDKIYIGQTVNLSDRLRQHNEHVFKGYTARFPGEWELIYKELAAARPEALKREKQLKSFRGREFVRKHIPR